MPDFGMSIGTFLNQKRREKREDEEYRNKERERAKEPGREVYKCEVCNCEMKKWNKRRHEKTDKHRANQNGWKPNRASASVLTSNYNIIHMRCQKMLKNSTEK